LPRATNMSSPDMTGPIFSRTMADVSTDTMRQGSVGA